MKRYLKDIFCFKKCLALIALITSVLLQTGYAQDAVLKVVPNKESAQYNIGENVEFIISFEHNGEKVKNVKVIYEIGPEKVTPTIKGEKCIEQDFLKINGGSLNEAGFLRCTATALYQGKTYKVIGTAGIGIDQIRPTNDLPSDFLTFWNNQIAAAAKIPLDSKLELIESRSTDVVSVYHISFQNHQIGSRIYGILSVPKKEGKYPAVIRYPGAGVRSHPGNPTFAAKGLITLEIGIHGIPVNMDAAIYDNLYRGALNGYPYFNLDSRDSYYFRRVILGCVKAIDFVYSLPQFDGEKLAVAGSSQGGALSIITTGLDKRVKYTLAFCPALSDLTGFFHGRAAGWPNMFGNSNRNLDATKDKIKTSAYYDVANFARYVTVSGFYSLGFNDEVTPPTSIYAAYNMIQGPKEFFIMPEIGHIVHAEQSKRWFSWLESKLLSK